MKALHIIKKTVVILVAIVAVLVMIATIISATTVDKSNRSLFGLKFFIVLSDSMKATEFSAGDMIVSVTVKDPSTLEVGDIITFMVYNEHVDETGDLIPAGSIVTHEIVEKTTNENGQPAFRTKGSSNNNEDDNLVTYDYVLGKYVFSIPKMGYALNFVKTVPGYILCIGVPFAILIISEIVNAVKIFHKIKKEEAAEIENERADLQAQKAETERMMAELMALKAQLNQQQQARADTMKTPENTGDTE